MRGYFKGVTLVALFNGVVVCLGALALGVPLAGTIGVVTFLMAYIPFVGAFIAGALRRDRRARLEGRRRPR